MSNFLTSGRIWATGALAAALVAALAIPQPASADGRWEHSVTVGGQDDYPEFDGEADFTIEATARIDADGVVSGDVTWSETDGTVIATGKPYCLEVRDNRAYFAFVSEAGTGFYGGTSYLPGQTVFMAFEDGGEGSGAGDMQSYIYDGSGMPSCDSWADFVDGQNQMVVDWLHGNVQVR